MDKPRPTGYGRSNEQAAAARTPASEAERRMRICLETSTFRARLAGIAYYTLFLAGSLIANEPDIRLLGFDGSRLKPLSSGELDRIREQRPSSRPAPAAALYQALRQVSGARSLFRAYKSLRLRQGLGRFDLFHAMNFMPPREIDAPALPLIHDISHERFPETHPAERTAWLRRRLAAIGRYPLVNTVSDFSADEISAFYGYPRDRIRVTRPGINPAFRLPAPEGARDRLRRMGLEAGRFFLSVGTIEPRKNHATLLSAYARLPQALRKRFPLVHVGQPGWGRLEPAHLGALSGEGSVRLAGYADEATLHMLYSSARALLFPTLYEGFGIPVAEAMAAGLPPIVSDIRVMREVAGDAASYAPPTDAAAWAEAISEAAEEGEAARAARREAARQRSAAFSWDETARQTAAIYRELI